MALNAVVLPAPFGPITEQIAPPATVKSMRLTAVMPPKRMVRPRISRMAIGLHRFQFVLPPLLRKQSLGAEPHHEDEHHAEGAELPHAHFDVGFALHEGRE